MLRSTSRSARAAGSGTARSWATSGISHLPNVITAQRSHRGRQHLDHPGRVGRAGHEADVGVREHRQEICHLCGSDVLAKPHSVARVDHPLQTERGEHHPWRTQADRQRFGQLRFRGMQVVAHRPVLPQSARFQVQIHHANEVGRQLRAEYHRRPVQRTHRPTARTVVQQVGQQRLGIPRFWRTQGEKGGHLMTVAIRRASAPRG